MAIVKKRLVYISDEIISVTLTADINVFANRNFPATIVPPKFPKTTETD